MQVMMSSLPRYQTVTGHRVPVEVANDPPFHMLAEAFEGRSKVAVRNDQKSSSSKARQQFLDLVRGKVPKSDVLSLVATINAAIFHYDKIPDIQAEDFVFLENLLVFLKEFGIIGERIFEPVDEELRARISIKEGTFDHYLFQWDQGTQKEAFEKEVVTATELAERMHASKKQALERQASRRREREHNSAGSPPLGEELKNREPVAEDLRRLVPEERSLVHSLTTAGRAPVNWIALAGETFRNKLTRRDYEQLAVLEAQTEPEERYLTPPGSPMH
jgi:hypothetical protein